ncbi:hypothetical protein EEB14_04210 [Rhodococcus sp. WS4]|nr:hypothetical protein EEB14_04210 [Rhodococcus sp. WS4]
MIVRYRHRANPTAEQQRMLSRSFGYARVVLNDAIRARQDALPRLPQLLRLPHR